MIIQKRFWIALSLWIGGMVFGKLLANSALEFYQRIMVIGITGGVAGWIAGWLARKGG